MAHGRPDLARPVPHAFPERPGSRSGVESIGPTLVASGVQRSEWTRSSAAAFRRAGPEVRTPGGWSPGGAPVVTDRSAAV